MKFAIGGTCHHEQLFSRQFCSLWTPLGSRLPVQRHPSRNIPMWAKKSQSSTGHNYLHDWCRGKAAPKSAESFLEELLDHILFQHRETVVDLGITRGLITCSMPCGLRPSMSEWAPKAKRIIAQVKSPHSLHCFVWTNHSLQIFLGDSRILHHQHWMRKLHEHIFIPPIRDQVGAMDNEFSIVLIFNFNCFTCFCFPIVWNTMHYK